MKMVQPDPRALESRYGMLELTHDAVIVRDAAGIIIFWNDAAEAIYGYSKPAAIGAHADQLLGIDLPIAEAAQASLHSLDQWEGECTHKTSRGRRILVASRRVVQRDTLGEPIAVLECNHDMSLRKQTEDKLRSSTRLLQAVMDCTASYIHVRGRRGEFLYVNKEYEKVFGVSSENVIGKTIEEVFSADVAAMRRKMHDTVLLGGADLHAEIVQMQEDGPHTYLDVKSPLFDEQGAVYAVYCLGTDITERKASEERMLQLAHYDVITGLPNRALFLDRLEVAVTKSHRTRIPMALLYLDLDRFKEVNDTLGHSSGDQLLIEAGRRIRGCVRASDTVARMGGDEFTVILEELESQHHISSIAEKILAAFATPFRIGNDDIYISTSIGITMCPGDAETGTMLLKCADQAMYLSKRLGGNLHNYFTPAMQDAAANRLRIVTDLRTACNEEQFSLYYQPIVDLATGAVHKAEALIRWHHPARGMVSPDEFIPLSEETGLIVPIGDWVFRHAAKQCAAWRQLYDKNFQISINTSPAQYRSNGIDFAGWMLHLHGLGLPAAGIAIEITEGLLMDVTDAVWEQIRQYRNANMQLSLDDFGTGYSSLSYLRKFKVDFLKIDRSFVANLTPDGDDLALCEAIIVMAHKLGISVIAEGIETKLQRDLLLKAGCDFGQGYFFAKPQTAAEFARLLAREVPAFAHS